MVFQKGKSGNPEGKKAGTSNKTTVIIKEAFKQAFQAMGGWEALMEWAQKNDKHRTEFYKLAARLIPTELVGKDGTPLFPPPSEDDKKNLDRFLIQKLETMKGKEDDKG